MKKNAKSPKSPAFQSTVGDLIHEVFEASLDEFGDQKVARRLCTQLLIRKLRREQKIKQLSSK